MCVCVCVCERERESALGCISAPLNRKKSEEVSFDREQERNEQTNKYGLKVRSMNVNR